MRENDDSLTAFLAQLLAAAPHIRKRHQELFNSDLPMIPIPFFGNLLTAKVVTVGLNPSDGELLAWPQTVDVNVLESRLLHYFDNPEFPPHPWFQPWVEALDELGVSYSAASAVHVDLCPWATRRASSLPEHKFTQLVLESLATFVRCMQLTSNARLVIMAGAVNRKYYINEFLASERGKLNYELSGQVRRGGQAFVGNQRLRIRERQLPVFFCSVSPSARFAHLLPVRVREHKQHLTSLLT